jgi:predicted esterase
VVAEPALHLLGVRAAVEQQAGGRMPERVQAAPRDTRLFRHRGENPAAQVARVERRSGH